MSELLEMWWARPALGALAVALTLVGCREHAPGDLHTRPAILVSKLVGQQAMAGPRLGAVPRKGRRLDERWAARPRFAKPPEGEVGLRCLPDGELGEWKGRSEVLRDERAKVIATAAGSTYTGAADLSAKLWLASYPGGLSVAVQIEDDAHRPASHLAAFASSDHVELRLWPVGGGPRVKRLAPKSAAAAAMGVVLRLGTRRQLIEFLKPLDQSWRGAAASASGVDAPGGYRIEARLPLSVLTPLTSGRITAVRYEAIIHDADQEGSTAAPTLRLAGEAKLAVPMVVHEGAQRRLSLRVCVGAEPDGLWGYRNGWRCEVPHGDEERWPSEDDRRQVPVVRFGRHRVPEPPRLQWLRERVVIVNFVGAQRGLVALVSKARRILSVLPVGVVGSRDPGNPRAHNSDAVPLKLPDGTWAVALTYAYPSPTGVAGGRCAAGHRVYASIIAARGAPESTPHKPAPEPDPPPHLEEVFRTITEDCVEGIASDWSLSKDRRVIQVKDLIHASGPVRTYVFKDGWYREAKE